MVLHSRGCGRVARRRILSSDLLVESLTGFPEGPFRIPLGVPVGRDAPGTPFFCVRLLVLVSRGVREAFVPQHPRIAWSVSVTVSNDVMRLTRYARAGSRESRYDGERQEPDD